MCGRVTAVRGTVVDVWFEDGLPPLGAALDCNIDDDGTVTAVVQSHLGKSSVRAIATDSTRGMRRGATVSSRGLPLRIPVGNQLIGRVIDLRGEARKPQNVSSVPCGLPMLLVTRVDDEPSE